MPDLAPNASHAPRSEIRVSGHTITLDPGVYCVFSVPEGPVPDEETGLPIARISPAPGRLANGIELLGLDPNGWVGPDAAMLVRVKQSRSNLLVTVYQAIDSASEAPQLQVVRISGPASADPSQEPGRTSASDQAEREPVRSAAEPVEIVAHVYGRGDVGAHLGRWTGEPGSKRWIEGFGISGIGGVPDADIEYQAVLGRGWLSPWSAGGQFCGSRGMSLPILGLRVRLRGDSAATHQVALTASFVDGSKVGPVAGGEACEAPTLAALEAFQLSIERTVEASACAEPSDIARFDPPSPSVKARPKAPKPQGAMKKLAVPLVAAGAPSARPTVVRRR